MQVDWIFVLCDHMLKAKRLRNFRLPYVILVSKFIEYFGIDVEDELKDSTGLLNHTSNQNLHKMGFLKVGNGWTVAGVLVGGVHDHEAGQVVQIKRKNLLLDPWTLFPTTLQRTEALCTHILRGWC